MRLHLLSSGIVRVPHLAYRMGLRRQPLEVVNEPFPAVLGVLVMPADVNRLFRTHLLAVPAEDATELVDFENERITIPFFVFTRHELDAVGWTNGRTKSTSDAFCFARFSGQHPMRSPPPRRDLHFLFGILDRHLVRLDQMPRGERHPLERCPEVTHVLDRTVENFNVDCHGRSPSDARGERAAICLSRAMRAASRRPYAGLIIRP